VARTLAEDIGHVIAAILLNWIAGFVDLVGWVVFLGLYTANMTGNLVAIGRAAAQGGSMHLLRSSVPVGGFFAGLLCSALWTRSHRKGWQPLAAEAVLLVPCTRCGAGAVMSRSSGGCSLRRWTRCGGPIAISTRMATASTNTRRVPSKA
jgi:hypothetical protein